MEETRGMRARFSSPFRLTQIRRRMFLSTEARVSCNNLSVAANCEHTASASSPTYLQLIGRGGKWGEPSRYNLDTPGPVAPEDLRAGAMSPGAALLGTQAPVPRITKSHSKQLTSLPSWVSVPTTLMPVAPCKAHQHPAPSVPVPPSGTASPR
jgi:hypothetical protein